MIIGIDNGVTGGAVAISRHHGMIISKMVMPVKKVGKSNEIDSRRFWLWCCDATEGDFREVSFVLEMPVGSKSAKAGISMSGSFHALRSTLESRGYICERVPAKQWQRDLRVNLDESKAKAIAKAKEIWPDEDWKPSPRHKNPHTGIVDAALIAWWYRSLRDTA